MIHETEKPSLTNTAGQMAMPIGLMWAASFLCSIYGMEYYVLSPMSYVFAIASVFVLRRQLAAYSRLYCPIGRRHLWWLALTSCLLAGLLTDAIQYIYFAFLDQGRLQSGLSTAMESEEYREAWSQLMPEVPLEMMQEMMASITIRDIMQHIVSFNIMLALPLSLTAWTISKSTRD